MTKISFETLDERTVAALCGIEVATLRNWCTLGYGPPYIRMTARKRMWLASDVADWLAERRVTPSRHVAPPQEDQPPKRRRGRPTKAEQLERQRTMHGCRDGVRSWLK